MLIIFIKKYGDLHVSRESSGYLKFPKKSIVNILLADEEKGGGWGRGRRGRGQNLPKSTIYIR